MRWDLGCHVLRLVLVAARETVSSAEGAARFDRLMEPLVIG